ncbi:hypothetical protein EC142526_03782 [Escherichia coli O145:H28]|nr:hypothetical protein EC142526_03782 [Escherichia coli O145:H28]
MLAKYYYTPRRILGEVISLFKNYGNFQLFTKLFGYSGHYLFGNPDFKINKASSVLHLYGVTQNMVAEDLIVVY